MALSSPSPQSSAKPNRPFGARANSPRNDASIWRRAQPHQGAGLPRRHGPRQTTGRRKPVLGRIGAARQCNEIGPQSRD
eukprot:4045173-Pyramimonas_sp.AAC.1